MRKVNAKLPPLISWCALALFVVPVISSAEPQWLPPPPDSWPKASKERFGGTECPVIAGIYEIKSQYVTYYASGKKPEFQEYDGAGYMVWGNWRVADIKESERHKSDYFIAKLSLYPKVSVHTFEVRQYNDRIEVAELNWPETDSVRVMVHKEKEGDYRCEGGWIFKRNTSGEGVGEGGFHRTESQIAGTRLENGDLLFYQRLYLRTGLIFKWEQTTLDYNWFPQIKGD